jgi:hypothetical protein
MAGLGWCIRRVGGVMNNVHVSKVAITWGITVQKNDHAMVTQLHFRGCFK